MSTVITFSRRNKKVGEHVYATRTSNYSRQHLQEVSQKHVEEEALCPSPAVATPTPGSPANSVDENESPATVEAKPAGKRWRRRGVPTAKQKQEADRQAYLKTMKTYYTDIDGFDLMTETPSPPPISKPHSSRHHAMSHGLSRRSSGIALPPRLDASTVNASPLKIAISKTARHTLQSLPEHDSTTLRIRRSSIAAPRLSAATGKMMSRMSLGFQEAFQWLGSRRGSVPHGVESSTKFPTPVLESPMAPSRKSSLSDLAAAMGKKLTLHTEAPNVIQGKSGPETHSTTTPPLGQLLALCGQNSAATLPSMSTLLGEHIDLSAVNKVGEGTFGEAFRAGDVVFKIVPLEGSTLVNGEPQKKAEEILAEAAITLTLSGLREGTTGNMARSFVQTYGVGLCRGAYAPELKREWQRWHTSHTSENESVDIFPADQLFVVFVVADGGLDLEHYALRSYDEMCSLLLQTAFTLAVAEEACEFEHRDLHWGNVLIKKVPSTKVEYTLRGVGVEIGSEKIQVTLIDFTLSRLVTLDGETVYCDLSSDPELFNGPKGDLQAETYRSMKKMTRGDWKAHAPKTNVAWLYYLCDICLLHKLKDCGVTANERKSLKEFNKRLLSYKSAGEVVWDPLFAGKWISKARE